MGQCQVPTEAVLDLRQRLSQLPPRCAERRHLIQVTDQLYGVSESTLYRALQCASRPHGVRRADLDQMLSVGILVS